ncbi:YqgE/AlgH family protein [Aureivirga sp. CE67]|uniref:YqgE/AlgH family protein n=1 Tax=Aureivirga sp. CE67 TaxID=1788983 RepID=UPI0018C9E232|nr:YqgE/AlgH family protein [Aureivirga sp. CE67]
MILKNPIKGNLLVAEPSILNDSSFNRTVILLTEHNQNEGSVGFILNKPTKYTLHDLIPSVKSSFKIYHGGPVEQENLYFIHKVPDLIPNSIEVADGIFWGGDFKIVNTLLNEDKLSEDDIRFFLGYSGWGSSQLLEEIKIDSWLVVENKYKNILKIDDSNIWKNQLLKMGGDYAIWANAPSNPNLN